MDGNDESSDHVIAKLIDMGFEFPQAVEAIEAVGPCLHDAVEFILNGFCNDSIVQDSNHGRSFSSYTCSTSQAGSLEKRTLSSGSQKRLKQSRIMEHVHTSFKAKKSKPDGVCDASTFVSESSVSRSTEVVKSSYHMNHKLEPTSESYQNRPEAPVKSELSLQENGSSQSQHFLPCYRACKQEIGADWEQRVNFLLHKHFGFSSLKSFQKEALEAWLANRDCLVLAATGSGKSLCFQIPALLTGKVVVVISPLISLMHDQCLKLVKCGVSACFLGSGQPDSSVEHKAMSGKYGVIYVCPETLLRLIEPLQRLAEIRGIALFAIDEVHCISKWGHDFRPDYRRLSVLRENFKACNLKSLEYDIPLMALTATATNCVREDIIESLHMSKGTQIVLTSFFRPNLQFSVKHSKTSRVSSYDKDFRYLIDAYTAKGIVHYRESSTISPDSEDESDCSGGSANGCISDADEISPDTLDNFNDEDDDDYGDNRSCADVHSANENTAASPKENQMSVEYLEDELDVCQDVDDLDVACGEFCGDSVAENEDFYGPLDTATKPERVELQQQPLEQGPTIIYVPTRKETLRLVQFLCRFGVRAAAYHAKLPKKHLRQVHEDFHRNILQVVVATIAFGMGIDKSNVRRIIHYGWPQSLEAYYQEAGRAGRDGKLAECTLFADLLRIPTLLPSQRSEEQTKHAYKMLSDCFRYGMATASCRAKILVNYFGEEFRHEKCLLCDVCVGGPPELLNMKAEADVFMQVLAGSTSHQGYSYDDRIGSNTIRGRFIERPNFRMMVNRIREQFPKFAASDRLWWQGLARILEDKGYIREGDNMVRVCIKYPELTNLGLELLRSRTEEDFYAYPEADMLLSMRSKKLYSTFSEWGRGWANPEIRRQRLRRMRCRRTRRKRSSRQRQDLKTVRGRIDAKLSKMKR